LKRNPPGKEDEGEAIALMIALLQQRGPLARRTSSPTPAFSDEKPHKKI
jgi:hypothetical protein